MGDNLLFSRNPRPRFHENNVVARWRMMFYLRQWRLCRVVFSFDGFITFEKYPNGTREEELAEN